MTAFAQGSNTHGAITADVTIRSYNSRHLDMAFYSPESCQIFEEDITEAVVVITSPGLCPAVLNDALSL